MKSPSTLILLICLLCLGSCRHDQKKNQKNPTNKKNSPAWKLAASFYENDPDSAFYYFSKLIETSKDSVEIARAYTCIGIIQNDKGFYYDSQESFIKSLKLLNDRDSSSYGFISNNYNELGLTEVDLKKFDDALSNFDQALLFSKDSSEILTILNNKAITLVEKLKYDEAIKLYDYILLKSKNEPQSYAMTLANQARTKWLKDPNYNPVPEMQTALEIRLKGNNKWGLNAGYGRLSEYYLNSSPDSALIYALKMYEVARELNSPDDIVFALQKMIQLGSVDSIKTYFAYYQHLNDSIHNAQKTAANRFAVIIYETEKHKTDKLELQKEKAEAQLRVIWLQVSSVILVIGAIIVFVWYRKRKRQAIKEQQLRISKKVHDKVANRVYRIMSEVEHQGIPEKGILLHKLDMVYQQSRDISYDQPHHHNQDFQQSITELLQSFASDTIRIASVGNSEAIWDQVTPVVREELSIILEELMTNMKKHSSAQNVVLKFIQKENSIELHYSDDGIGLAPEVNKGNGLRNTETRIKDIGGTIIFEKTGSGLKIQITIPIAK